MKNLLEGIMEDHQEFISMANDSIGEMMKLRTQIEKQNLFPNPNDKEEVMLLIDNIIWEEAHAAGCFRRIRKQAQVDLAELVQKISERNTG